MIYRLYRLSIHSVSINSIVSTCTFHVYTYLPQSCNEIHMNECLYLMSADFSYVGDTAGEGKLYFCYSHDRNFQGLGNLLLEQFILGCGIIFII